MTNIVRNGGEAQGGAEDAGQCHVPGSHWASFTLVVPPDPCNGLMVIRAACAIPWSWLTDFRSYRVPKFRMPGTWPRRRNEKFP